MGVEYLVNLNYYTSGKLLLDRVHIFLSSTRAPASSNKYINKKETSSTRAPVFV